MQGPDRVTSMDDLERTEESDVHAETTACVPLPPRTARVAPATPEDGDGAPPKQPSKERPSTVMEADPEDG